MPLDALALSRKFKSLSVPEPEEGEDNGTHLKRLGAIDVTERWASRGAIIGLGRRPKQ